MESNSRKTLLKAMLHLFAATFPLLQLYCSYLLLISTSFSSIFYPYLIPSSVSLTFSGWLVVMW